MDFRQHGLDEAKLSAPGETEQAKADAVAEKFTGAVMAVNARLRSVPSRPYWDIDAGAESGKGLDYPPVADYFVFPTGDRIYFG